MSTKIKTIWTSQETAEKYFPCILNKNCLYTEIQSYLQKYRIVLKQVGVCKFFVYAKNKDTWIDFITRQNSYNFRSE